MLQLFDLVEVVDEGFGDLLDEERSVGHLELDLLLNLVVILRCHRHLLRCDSLRHLAGSLQGG